MKDESKNPNRYCPKCNTLLLEKNTRCPGCNREVKKLDVAVTWGFNLFFRLLLFLFFIAVIGGIVYLYMTNRELLISYYNGLVNFFK
jgi:preprotein translocase subunit SecY